MRLTAEVRQAIHDAVIEAAEARRMGRDGSDREGLAWRVVAILERWGQEEMGVWSAENAQRNAERRADRQERERQARTEDLNASAFPNRVALDELRRRQGRG